MEADTCIQSLHPRVTRPVRITKRLISSFWPNEPCMQAWSAHYALVRLWKWRETRAGQFLESQQKLNNNYWSRVCLCNVHYRKQFTVYYIHRRNITILYSSVSKSTFIQYTDKHTPGIFIGTWWYIHQLTEKYTDLIEEHKGFVPCAIILSPRAQ
jgi:hypothetical protein